jgi:hypothetical protein
VISAHLDGVITGRELGPEFWLDGETADDDGLVLVRLKVGRGLYLDRAGTLHAHDRVTFDAHDWLFLAGVWLLTLSGGLFIGYTIGQNESIRATTLIVVSVLLAFAVGWVVRRFWRH